MTSESQSETLAIEKLSKEFTTNEQALIKLLLHIKVSGGIHARLTRIISEEPVQLSELKAMGNLELAHQNNQQELFSTIREIAELLGITRKRVEELQEYVLENERNI